jgi:hypothetical protein
MSCKVFLVRAPVIYSDKIQNHRTYVINPKKVRMVEYSPHFKKMDVSFDNGEKYSFQNHDDMEDLYHRLVSSIEEWAKEI